MVWDEISLIQLLEFIFSSYEHENLKYHDDPTWQKSIFDFLKEERIDAIEGVCKNKTIRYT